MAKTTTLNIRINPEVKKKAEDVLSRLGIPMSTAINMYLNQISLTGGIPFSIELPQPPKNINANLMTDEELKAELMKGIEDIKNGRVQSAEKTFAELERTWNIMK